jgi:hypothetical protein
MESLDDDDLQCSDSNIDVVELRRRKRLQRNKESARRSREKKKQQTNCLQERLDALLEQNEELKRQNAALQEQLLAVSCQSSIPTGTDELVRAALSNTAAVDARASPLPGACSNPLALPAMLLLTASSFNAQSLQYLRASTNLKPAAEARPLANTLVVSKDRIAPCPC